MDKEVKLTMELDLKGNEKLDKLTLMIIGIKSKKTSAFPFSSPKKT